MIFVKIWTENVKLKLEAKKSSAVLVIPSHFCQEALKQKQVNLITECYYIQLELHILWFLFDDYVNNFASLFNV